MDVSMFFRSFCSLLSKKPKISNVKELLFKYIRAQNRKNNQNYFFQILVDYLKMEILKY